MAIEKKIIVTVETSQGAQNIEKINDSITLLNAKQNELKENIKGLQKAYKDAAGDTDAQAEANRKLAQAQTELNSNSMKLRDAKKELNLETKSQKDAEGSLLERFSSMPGIVGKAGQSIQGLGTAFKTLAANPVGAVIMLIVGAVTLLYNIFKDFKPLLDKIEQGFAAVSAVTNVLKESVIGLISGTDDASDSMDGLGESMKRAALAAISLKKAQQDLEDLTDINMVKNAQIKQQIDELLVQSKDRTKSEEERIALINKATSLESERYAMNKEQSDKEVEIALNTIILGKKVTGEEYRNIKERGIAYLYELQNKRTLRDEDIKNYRDALIKQQDIFGQHTQIIEKAQNKADALAEKAEADREKAAAKRQADREKATAKLAKQQDNIIKSDKAALEEFILLQGKVNEERLASDENYYFERMDLMDINKEKAKAIIDEEVKYGKKTLTEANTEKLKLDNQYSDAKKDLTNKRITGLITDLKYEVDLEKLKNDEILAGKKLTNEQLHKLELERIEKDKEAKLKELNDRLISEPEKEKEIKQQIEIVNQTAKTETAKSDAEFNKSQAEIKEQNIYTDYSNQLAALSEFSMERFDIQSKQYELDRQNELSNTELTAEQRKSINEKYDSIDRQLEDTKFNYKLNIAKDLVSAVSSIMGEGTKAAKLAASTATVINTYQEISGIFASTAKWGPVGWALGIAKAAGAAITGAATVKKIWAADGKSSATATPNAATIVPPQISATSNTLTSTESNLQNKAQKVYVLESDITDAQQKVKTASVASTF